MICYTPPLKSLHHLSHWSRTWIDGAMNFCLRVKMCICCVLLINSADITHLQVFLCFPFFVCVLFREGRELKWIRILNASWSYSGEMCSLRFLDCYVRDNLRLCWSLFTVCPFLKVKTVVRMPSWADYGCNMEAELKHASFVHTETCPGTMHAGGQREPVRKWFENNWTDMKEKHLNSYQSSWNLC